MLYSSYTIRLQILGKHAAGLDQREKPNQCAHFSSFGAVVLEVIDSYHGSIFTTGCFEKKLNRQTDWFKDVEKPST